MEDDVEAKDQSDENHLKQSAVWFEKWCRGQTGVPFVDANMRELLATGSCSACVGFFVYSLELSLSFDKREHSH